MSIYQIICMDTSWTTCGCCGIDIPMSIRLALPMYEGEVNFQSPVSFPVCKKCYDNYDGR